MTVRIQLKKRRKKYFMLEINSEDEVVSIDRLKPYYSVINDNIHAQPEQPKPILKENELKVLKPKKVRQYLRVRLTKFFEYLA